MAYIIHTDQRWAEEVTPTNGRKFELKQLQEIVGGYIELVRTPSGRMMVVNEDGIALGLPLNHAASQIVGGPILGDVLVCESFEID